MGAVIESKPFAGVRSVVRAPHAFDQVVKTLRALMGTAGPDGIHAVARQSTSEAEFARLVEQRYVGKSGFMLFAELNHSDWLPTYGIAQRVVRWIIGNPLLAITMIRHDITAGLFAPVELLIVEDADKTGTTLTWVRPSSLMLIEDNPPLRKAALVLDLKLDALVAEAARGSGAA
jgi:uncharacterized protein (DUF302 family)